VLDYARSYSPVVRGVTQAMTVSGCVEECGLSRGQMAAFRFHGEVDLRPAARAPACPWLVVASDFQPIAPLALDMGRWELVATVRRPTDAHDNVLLYRRRGAAR
jgi:hypothetical protein